VGDVPGFHNVINHNTGNGVMQIPQSVCDGDSGFSELEITSRFLHEFLHGHIAELLQHNFPNGDPGDWYLPDPDKPGRLIFNTDYWLDLVKVYNNTTSPPSNEQHVLFFTHLLDTIAEALAAIAGTGTKEDYMYFAHQIINSKSIANRYGGAIGLPENLDYNQTGEGQYFESQYTRWTAVGGHDVINVSCND
jgi:hypothetical protein